MPPMISCQLAALTIAGIFYIWRDMLCRQVRHTKVLRDRVAYMLWVAASR